jgi:hypothetical protein
MIRRLFTFASALSLLLCVVTVVLWVRSYGNSDTHEFNHSGARWEVVSDRGKLVLDDEPQKRLGRQFAQKMHEKYIEDFDRGIAEYKRIWGDIWGDNRVSGKMQRPRAPLSENEHDELGEKLKELVRVQQERKQTNSVNNANWQRAEAIVIAPAIYHSIPHRVVASIAAVPSAVWLTLSLVSRRRKHRRRIENRCPSCGYDLRASKTDAPNAARRSP